LCPEEKPKVGELMMTLEKQRTANDLLTSNIKQEISRRENASHLINELNKEVVILRIKNE
jgi:hypothetical protein